ncbi:MAG TPA: homoserine dehydrogenase, partial [Planctomycetaceae bacterium]|nr:homoserine dehydrogenase [Planctomycetaceae bacterium]
MSPLQIAIVGLGNVGSGVARILTNHADTIARRAGRPIVIRRAIVRDLSRDRGITLPKGVVTDDLESVISDPNIEVVAQLMGGLEPARTVMLRLLEAGKNIVTANKALLCEHGDEIFA